VQDVPTGEEDHVDAHEGDVDDQKVVVHVQEHSVKPGDGSHPDRIEPHPLNSKFEKVQTEQEEVFV
jgi:hypothetical protein